MVDIYKTKNMDWILQLWTLNLEGEKTRIILEIFKSRDEKKRTVKMGLKTLNYGSL